MPPTALRSDRTRQVTVTVAEVLCVLGTLLGVGVLGGPGVAGSASGALAADATLLAPASPAFAIWTPIYVGLAAYTVWQWLPDQASDVRHRRTGYLAAASMVLNAAWLLVSRAGWLEVSVLVMAMLVACLGVLVTRLGATPSYGTGEAVLVDGTFGAYLGWVCVAACANVTATLVARGVDPGRPVSDLLGVLVVAAASALGVVLARRLGGRWAVAAALAWGLGWVTWGRWAGEPPSAATGLAALVGAVVVLSATGRQHHTLPV
ncbi:MAG TPA: tryptophan-rich sensory protein [Dermatophilaceae bacterium]|nr:tryptophan-rich sensory protein [Dermatophilaceae bacterium]